jgi:hypothetical protein
MKKVLMGLSVLLLVLSGVTAVSAYEAHLVNVTAYVENAISTNVPWPGGKLDFGTVFPQEFLAKEFRVRFSTSFCQDSQLRVEHLDYEVWVEDKPLPGGGVYPCLADAMYIGIQDVFWNNVKGPIDMRPTAVGGDLVPVGTCNLPKKVTGGTLSKVDGDPVTPGIQWENHDDDVWVVIDVPVFREYYNELTDALGCDPNDPNSPKKPNGMCVPTVIIEPDDPYGRYHPDGGDPPVILGADVIIQVVDIYE